MLIITGAAGFIGSCLVGWLNAAGREDLILVDDFTTYEDKTPNLIGKQFAEKIERTKFIGWWDRQRKISVEAVFHLGARTDTAETDTELFDRLNYNYSQAIWERCADRQIPLIYASSAATYGGGELGYHDDHGLVEKLKPLNAYGRSKNDFDAWALHQTEAPPHWYGLKFFNVYGPNEYHKGRMASVIYHAFRQIKATGKMKLFRSHRDDVADGEQSRDFIYVMDLCRIMHWLWEAEPENGLYNCGTGTSRTFLDLVRATFSALDRPSDISFVDTPADIRDNYQYFTEADMDKLRSVGYPYDLYSLEEGVEDYVGKFLVRGEYF